MESAKLPKSLSLEGNICENFRRFKINFLIYLKATGLIQKDSKTRVAILLNVIGEEAVELFDTLDLTEAQKENFEAVLEAFENYASPRKNVVIERFNFSCRIQEEGETVDSFITDLKKLSKTCEFGDQTESLIRDRIVFGIEDKGTQERLLRIKDLDLGKAVDYSRATESSRRQAETLQGKKKPSVCLVKSTNNQAKAFDSYRKTNDPGKTNDYNKNENKGVRSKMSGQMTKEYRCKKCNRVHEYAKCPAYGKKCLKCDRPNHFAVVCKWKQIREVRTRQEPTDYTDSDSSEFEINGVRIYKVSKMDKRAEWTQNVSIGSKEYTFKVDTGAEVSIITKKMLRKLAMENLMRKSKVYLENYGGTKFQALGVIKLMCEIPGREGVNEIEFVVVDDEVRSFQPLLGLKECKTLMLVQRVNFVTYIKTKDSFLAKYKEQFSGLGTFKGEYKIKLKDDAQPVMKPPRRIPQSVKSRLEVTLKELENRGIIAKEDHPDSWVSSLVIREKRNGSLRCCIDPYDLNKAIVKNHFLIPTIDDISPKLTNKAAFTVLDLKDGFWHVKLEEESSKLCTFSTPFGCYRFKRLPFGLTTAPEAFQKLNQENFGDLKGVSVYFDDLLIAGETPEEHDKILEAVMERAKQLNVKFNKNKLQYRVPEVKYLGQIFTKNGIKPDPDKIQAIQMLKTPTNRKELQKVLGTANYLRKYIPNMAAVTNAFRELLKKDNEWAWMPTHERAFKQLKDKIAQAQTMTIWDPKQPMLIQADSSKDGMGCCLLQQGKPIAFASRSLSAAEINYAQVEKELLAIVFATKKFHLYIYGRQVEVETDHKPLVSIFKKEVHRIASTRLQRMRLKLLNYDLKVKYLPGNKMFVADLLSRNYIQTGQETEEGITEMIHVIRKRLSISEEKEAEFRQATKQDKTLRKVMEYHHTGWTKKTNKLTPELDQYRKMQGDLTVEQGLVYVGEKIVVPSQLRKNMLELVHSSHFGIEKTKQKARQIMYWPGMGADIAKTSKNCVTCGKFARNNKKEPIIRHELPELPFEMVGADIMELAGKSYLVLACYLTRWLEIKPIYDKTARSVIKELCDIFTTHGIPEKIIADNMPFGSSQFNKFAKEWGIKVITSSPHYPKSNGLAEKMVGIAKGIMRRAQQDGRDYRKALMEYRNSPLIGHEVSPSQLLMSRRLRTTVPVNKSLLEPQIQTNYRERMKELREKQNRHYNRTATARPGLNKGQSLWYREGHSWQPAQVVDKYQTPRSYIIENSSGRELRRNTVHLRRSDVPFKREQEDDDASGILQTLDQKKNNKIQENRTESGDQKTTRSGRPINRPQRLKDYV